jgi:cation transport regulator ChaC
MWIFGYGSLVWRPAFPFSERVPGYIRGYARRFWQGSTDHRGTPEAPGRVVTLTAEPDALCWGMAYCVEPGDRDHVLAQLDHREQGGYQRVDIDVHLSANRALRALMYIATVDNPNYVGPAPIDDIARVIRASHGPSGSNLEYVLRLAQALDDIGACDPHVSELARLLAE